MKIDTKTAESDILIDGKGLLGKHQPNIIYGVLAGRAEGQKLKEILSPFDHDFYLLASDGAVKRDQIECHSELLNYLVTRKLPKNWQNSIIDQ